jgi:hypothetical protein
VPIVLVAVGVVFGIVIAAGVWLTTTAAALPNEPLWMQAARARQSAARIPTWLRALSVVSLSSFFIGIAMFIACFSSNPQKPDPATGHIYAMNDHGSYVYVTRADYLRINGMMFGGIAIGMAGGIGHLLMERRSERTSRRS